MITVTERQLLIFSQDDSNASAGIAAAAVSGDELPAQGAGWEPLEEDALDEQVLTLACIASMFVWHLSSLGFCRRLALFDPPTLVSGAQSRVCPQQKGGWYAGRSADVSGNIVSNVQVMRFSAQTIFIPKSNDFAYT